MGELTEIGKVVPRRNGLCKHVLEVKKGPLELGSGEANGKVPGERGGRGRESKGFRGSDVLGKAYPTISQVAKKPMRFGISTLLLRIVEIGQFRTSRDGFV